jgi:hypothetical protein
MSVPSRPGSIEPHAGSGAKGLISSGVGG